MVKGDPPPGCPCVWLAVSAITLAMHLLYIEHDPRDIELFRLAMDRLGTPVALATVPDEATALDYLLNRGEYAHRPAKLPMVIFLDLKLENSLGSDLIGQIRQHSEFSLIPIVMLTSSRDPLDEAECYRQGANAYMAKSMAFADFADDLCHAILYWSQANNQSG